jgi:UDP-glucose 4-epimerase
MKRNWKDLPVVIAGGAGFIGSNLAKRLVELGAKVRVIDQLLEESGASWQNLSALEGQIEWRRGDVRERSLLDPLLTDAKVIFNLVGVSGHRQSVGDPFTDLLANCAAPLAVLDGCRRMAPDAMVVYASSRQIYGRAQRLPIAESHPIQPLDINAVHTATTENYHRVYADALGIQTRTLRLTHTIGPGMRIKDARQSFVGWWIRCLLEGRPIEVWGGEQRRDVCTVDDVVEALLAVAQSDPDRRRVFNISGEVLSLRALAELLIGIHGSGSYLIQPMPEDQRAIDLGDSYADASRLAALVQLPPPRPLPGAIKETLDFYRAQLAAYT